MIKFPNWSLIASSKFKKNQEVIQPRAVTKKTNRAVWFSYLPLFWGVFLGCSAYISDRFLGCSACISPRSFLGVLIIYLARSAARFLVGCLARSYMLTNTLVILVELFSCCSALEAVLCTISTSTTTPEVLVTTQNCLLLRMVWLVALHVGVGRT